jgi:hypothetical protein
MRVYYLCFNFFSFRHLGVAPYKSEVFVSISSVGVEQLRRREKQSTSRLSLMRKKSTKLFEE